MDCRQCCDEVVFLFIDREITADLEAPFQHHIAHCPECASNVRHTRRLVFLVRERCVRMEAPPRLRARILTSLPHRQGWA
jgi:mycothiol system anti-sigma-R factor